MSPVQSLHVLEHIDIKSDHFAVQLHIACEQLQNVHVHELSAPSEPRIRYDAQQVEANQERLAAELQQHWVPHVQQYLGINALADKLVGMIRLVGMPARSRLRCAIIHTALVHRGLLQRSDMVL